MDSEELIALGASDIKGKVVKGYYEATATSYDERYKIHVEGYIPRVDPWKFNVEEGWFYEQTPSIKLNGQLIKICAS